MSKITYEQAVQYAQEVGRVHDMRPTEIAEYAAMHAVFEVAGPLTTAEYVGGILFSLEIAGQYWE